MPGGYNASQGRKEINKEGWGNLLKKAILKTEHEDNKKMAVRYAVSLVLAMLKL